MQLGMIGLGRMGGNMAVRLLRGGHAVVGWDPAAAPVQTLAAAGGTRATSLDDLLAKLAPPRAVWLMVPAGAPTEETTLALAERLAPGDVVVDGGNTFFEDDVRRARLLAQKGVRHRRQANTFGEKLLSAMRRQFGGHGEASGGGDET
jgi:6-phosphogluconate dehydrogenase